MKAMPQVQKFMTPNPHTIGHDMSLRTALSVMREYRIRHLPVQNGGKLVGILTDRDLKLAGSFGDAGTMKVEEIMSPDVYTVTPESPLDRVVHEMASHKYGSAIIQQENGKVVGIFTAVDGLQVLGETLQNFYRSRE